MSVEQLVQLEENEHVLLEVRRHMFMLYAKMASLLVFFFLLLAFSPAAALIIDNVTGGSYGNLVAGFLFMLTSLALWTTFFYYWTDYYLDVWIVTTQRIFDIEQKSLFRREISVTRLEQVQDVTISINGIFATFLKFGDIHIHTAGSEIDFTIKNAADPLKVKETIMHAHAETYKKEPKGPLLKTS